MSQAKQEVGEEGTGRVEVTCGKAAPEHPGDCEPPVEPEPPQEGIIRSPPGPQTLPSPPNHHPQQEALPAVKAETGRGLSTEAQVEKLLPANPLPESAKKQILREPVLKFQPTTQYVHDNPASSMDITVTSEELEEMIKVTHARRHQSSLVKKRNQETTQRDHSTTKGGPPFIRSIFNMTKEASQQIIN